MSKKSWLFCLDENILGCIVDWIHTQFGPVINICTDLKSLEHGFIHSVKITRII